eukprot:scaffold111326_cov54-Phaeocystis_antarctica.AAC.2
MYTNVDTRDAFPLRELSLQARGVVLNLKRAGSSRCSTREEAVRRGACGGSRVASALRGPCILCHHRTRVDVVQEGVHALGGKGLNNVSLLERLPAAGTAQGAREEWAGHAMGGVEVEVEVKVEVE